MIPGTIPFSCACTALTYVQTRNTSTRIAAIGPVASAARRARRFSSPSTRRVRNSAPWKVNSASVMRPPRSAYGTSEVEEVARERARRVDRDAPDEVRERDPPEQRGHPARDREQRVPAGSPLCVRALVAVLDRDTADDQPDEDEEEREVERGEHRRVPGREGSERRATRDEEPDLVPVPDRADRVHQRAPLLFGVPDETLEDADPEVESLEHEVADPEDRDQEEPEGLQVPVAVGVRLRASISR